MNSPEGLKQLLQEAQIPADSREARKLAEYLTLLRKWNPHINLTASTEWPVLRPLFMEALWASRFHKKTGSHLDIGSGAGFPALLLKILAPQMTIDLVESRSKKCAFLESAADLLQLDGTRVHCTRLAEFLDKETRTWDCISWKALKLQTRDLLRLRRHAHEQTKFWMFHGAEPAVQEPKVLNEKFRRAHREDFPERDNWHLSVFHVKHDPE